MKVESWIFIGGTPLFFAFGIVYGVVTDWNEWVGTSCLFLTGGLSVMIGAYLAYTARHIDAARRTTPTVRSPRAPASSVSSRRTRGGRWPSRPPPP